MKNFKNVSENSQIMKNLKINLETTITFQEIRN